MSDAPADALMSVVAVPFVAGLPQWRILLVFLTYALASYPFVFTLVLTWANPLMIQHTGLVEMTASHALSRDKKARRRRLNDMSKRKRPTGPGPYHPERHVPMRDPVGPPRVFEEILSEHLDALYRTALHLSGGRRADAEDLLQDAMLRALRGVHGLRDPAASRAWLFTILSRTYLDRMRAAQRRAEVLSSELDEHVFEQALEDWDESVVVPDALLARRQVRDDLLSAVNHMTPSLQVVLWLVDVEGFRQREVAAMLDIATGTVASRLYRARVALRDALANNRDDFLGRHGS